MTQTEITKFAMQLDYNLEASAPPPTPAAPTPKPSGVAGGLQLPKPAKGQQYPVNPVTGFRSKYQFQPVQADIDKLYGNSGVQAPTTQQWAAGQRPLAQPQTAPQHPGVPPKAAPVPGAQPAPQQGVAGAAGPAGPPGAAAQPTQPTIRSFSGAHNDPYRLQARAQRDADLAGSVWNNYQNVQPPSVFDVPDAYTAPNDPVNQRLQAEGWESKSSPNQEKMQDLVRRVSGLYGPEARRQAMKELEELAQPRGGQTSDISNWAWRAMNHQFQ